MDFNEWREQFPKGTRILWHDNFDKKGWLPGCIVGHRANVLTFRLDSDSHEKGNSLRILSLKNRDLLKKEEAAQ